MATKRLPGLEDPAIEALHELAEQYVKYRDKRQQLLAKEVELKQQILDEMHKNKKKTYRHDGIEISIEVEEETVKVKVVKPDPDEESE